MAGERFTFVSSSENDDLDSDAYGSTWASSAFVRKAFADEIGTAPFHRLPRGLCGYQDVYIVVREDGVDFSSFDFNPGVEGYIDVADCARRRA